MPRCKICDEMVSEDHKEFGRHLWEKHRIKPNDYRVQYQGLPPKCARPGCDNPVPRQKGGGWFKCCSPFCAIEMREDIPLGVPFRTGARSSAPPQPGTDRSVLDRFLDGSLIPGLSTSDTPYRAPPRTWEEFIVDCREWLFEDPDLPEWAVVVLMIPTMLILLAAVIYGAVVGFCYSDTWPGKIGGAVGGLMVTALGAHAVFWPSAAIVSLFMKMLVRFRLPKNLIGVVTVVLVTCGATWGIAIAREKGFFPWLMSLRQPANVAERQAEEQKAYADLSSAQVEEKANNGNAAAMFDLSTRYYSGRTLDQDYAKAIQWSRAAADKGHLMAMHNLGVIYQHGHGAPIDEAESFRWYLKAAQQGQPESVKYVALMYSLGVGVEQNHAESLAWFKRSAELGNTQAFSSIAHKYFEGRGIPQDYGQAREWYLKAAAAGDKNAYLPLYLIYFSGLGVPRDDAEARKWMQKADSEGLAQPVVNDFLDRLAHTNPDGLYDFGVSIDQRGERDKAIGVLLQAADSGSQKARNWLREHGIAP